ncbi:cell division protein ZapA [Luteimonas sp. e5]
MSERNEATEAVSVRILERDYTVGARPAERDSLLAAARALDMRMRELRGDNRMVAMERIAVLAALNLAHELELLRERNREHDRAMNAALDVLEQRLARLPAE